MPPDDMCLKPEKNKGAHIFYVACTNTNLEKDYISIICGRYRSD